MTLLLAAIRAVPTPVPPSAPSGAATPPAIRGIAPPVDIPEPLWQSILLITVAVALLALAAWVIWRCWPKALPEPPPTPRQLALAELERLRAQVHTLDPHLFSFEVSSVLRRFIEAQFGLHALEQTSDEFLATSARDARFSISGQKLLAEFLERSDMIKFARQGADETASEMLLGSAFNFIQGGIR